MKLRTTALLLVALAPTLAACADNPRRIVLLPQAFAPRLTRPVPGAPRVRLDGDKLEGVELREVVAYELVPYAHESPGVSASGDRAEPLGRAVCRAPCLDVIDGRRGQAFFIGGEGLSDSETFLLGDRSGNLHIRVGPGPLWARRAGGPLTGVGFAGFITGAVLLGIGSRAEVMTKPGAVVFGFSSTLLVTGLAFLVAGRTSVDLTHGED